LFTLSSMPLKASIIKRHLKSLFVIGEISCLKGQKIIHNMKKWPHHKLWAKKSRSLFHGWNNKMQNLRGPKVPCWHYGCFCIFNKSWSQQTKQWHWDLATKLLVAIFAYESKKSGARIELMSMQRVINNNIASKTKLGMNCNNF
jgi:hypothetical protein